MAKHVQNLDCRQSSLTRSCERREPGVRSQLQWTSLFLGTETVNSTYALQSASAESTLSLQPLLQALSVSSGWLQVPGQCQQATTRHSHSGTALRNVTCGKQEGLLSTTSLRPGGCSDRMWLAVKLRLGLHHVLPTALQQTDRGAALLQDRSLPVLSDHAAV